MTNSEQKLLLEILEGLCSAVTDLKKIVRDDMSEKFIASRFEAETFAPVEQALTKVREQIEELKP